MELPPAAIAALTCAAENNSTPSSVSFRLRTPRKTFLMRGSDVWGRTEVNCLLKRLAMAVDLEYVRLPKEIGRFGAGRLLLPDNVRKVDQKCLVLEL